MPTMRQAMASPERTQWQKAMEAEELQQLDLMGTFAPPPRSFTTWIETMFVLKHVFDAEGKPGKFKARLVCVGSHQPIGTYEYCSSATARTCSVKLVLALLASYNLRS